MTLPCEKIMSQSKSVVKTGCVEVVPSAKSVPSAPSDSIE